MKIPLSQIEPNHWNPNEVKGDKYTQLAKDMSENGQREAITLSPYNVFYEDPDAPEDEYVLCDGEHRYRVAKSLGWTEIEANIEELTEDEALTKFYRMQAVRGDLNPIKDARLFQYNNEELGLTQEQIAEKFNRSREYVKDRLSLLRLSPVVQEAYTDFPKVVEARIRARGYNEDEEQIQELVEVFGARAPSFSHYRELAKVPELNQNSLLQMILDRIIDGETVSKRQLAADVKQIKAKLELAQRVSDAQMKAVRKTCIECGAPPAGFMGIDEEIFVCAENPLHTWYYMLTEEEEIAQQEQREREAQEQLRRQDFEIITEILDGYPDGVDRETLRRDFYTGSRYYSKQESDKVLDEYLAEHPDIELIQPPKPETSEEEEPLNEHEIHDLKVDAEEYPDVDEELNQALGIPPMPESSPLETPETETTVEPKVKRYVTTDAAPETLYEQMAVWALTKAQELDKVDNISFKGVNKQGTPVSLTLRPYGNGAIRYTTGTYQDPIEAFDILIASWTSEGKTVVQPNNTNIAPEELEEQKDRIMFFFQHIWQTELDPWDIPEPEEEPVISEEVDPLPDHGRDYAEEKCIKCGKPASDRLNIDEYGYCDECAGRDWVPNPIWCTMFRNLDKSQPYCSEPFYKDNEDCENCPVYQENLEAEQEAEDEPEDEVNEGTVLCASCGKQVPPTQYCINCAEPLLPAEAEGEAPDIVDVENSEHVKQWLDTPIKDLRALRDSLTPEETEHLLEHETRKGALGLLSKHMEAISPPAEPIEAEDD